MGYLPPTAAPPTKKPIMTLMKQARAFGVGVVLATQNPVDIDYKAISNAGTWMVGRLQTERDKDRLLDGMSAADGGVDVKAVSDTISGLDKREFVLRRAGEDQPEVFTTRWAMSYLRGPLTRDQIKQLMGDDVAGRAASARPSVRPTPHRTAAAPTAAATRRTAPTRRRSCRRSPTGWRCAGWRRRRRGWPTSAVTLPAPSTNRRSSPGCTCATTRPRPTSSTTSTQRRRAVPARCRHRPEPRRHHHLHRVRPARLPRPPSATYRLTSAPIGDAKTWKQVERGLIDHLVRTGSIELQVNKELKLYSVPERVRRRTSWRDARSAAQAAADADKAKLRDEARRQGAKLERPAGGGPGPGERRRRAGRGPQARQPAAGRRRPARRLVRFAAQRGLEDRQRRRPTHPERRRRARRRGQGQGGEDRAAATPSWTSSSPPSRRRSTPSGRPPRPRSRPFRSASSAPTSR